MAWSIAKKSSSDCRHRARYSRARFDFGAEINLLAGYYALTIAMRTGDVSAVTPFRYTRLVFALILGATVFGERPDAWTLLGSAIVVGSGVFALVGRR